MLVENDDALDVSLPPSSACAINEIIPHRRLALLFSFFDLKDVRTLNPSVLYFLIHEHNTPYLNFEEDVGTINLLVK